MRPLQKWKHIAVSVSAACLLFAGSIRSVLFPVEGIRSWAVDVNPIEAAALLLLIGLSGLVLFGFLVLSDSAMTPRTKMEVHLLFLLFAAIAFGPSSLELFKMVSPVDDPFVNYLLPLSVLLVCILISWRSENRLASTVELMRGLLLLLFPAAVVLLMQCISVSLTAAPSEKIIASTHEPAETRSGDSNKVVWIVFDELDQAALIKRPPRIQTPAFDRIMASSFVADSALPPAQDTKESIPSFLYGRPVLKSEPGLIERWTGFAGRTDKDYFRTDEGNLIDDLRRNGLRSGVVGWYIPYERIFGAEDTFGEWQWQRKQKCQGLFDCGLRIWGVAVAGMPLGNPLSVNALLTRLERGQTEDTPGQHQRNTYLMGHAASMTDRRDYDLRLFHFSVPHSPYVSIDTENYNAEYFDGLELADENLAKILERLDRNGQLSETTLIVTADHWWRRKSPAEFKHLDPSEAKAAGESQTVPFIVKFPGSNSRISFKRTFNTVIMRELINHIVKGKIRSNDDLATFIEGYISEHPELAAFRPNWLPAD